MTNAYNLPHSQLVDVRVLSRLFKNTTNSYKLVFFIALLDILEILSLEEFCIISLRKIHIQMLANCWYPYIEFRLSFGIQDQIAKKLEDLKILAVGLNKPTLKVLDNNKKYLKYIISKYLNDDDLLKYVPFRLLRPFFSELKGIKDSKVNSEIVRLAELLFQDRKPLYKFSTDEKSIIVHPDWVNYLHENRAIVRGWAAWSWANYMQSKNLNTPNIINKLFPTLERASMERQRKYWSSLLKEKPDEFRCIYSGQALNSNNFSLDHYIPWTFVAHNQIWNLIPIPKDVNSSKSNIIPDNRYIDDFISIQYKGIQLSYQISEKSWKRNVEAYVIDLGFSNEEELLNADLFKSKLEPEIHSLIYRAINQGFEAGWAYSA